MTFIREVEGEKNSLVVPVPTLNYIIIVIKLQFSRNDKLADKYIVFFFIYYCFSNLLEMFNTYTTVYIVRSP